MRNSRHSFFEITPDIFAEHVPELQIALHEEINLTGGKFIAQPIPTPLIYLTGHDKDNPPKAFHNRCEPVMSDEFIEALILAGIKNLQTFPAEIRSEVDSSVWTNYKAVNILGLMRAADLNGSDFQSLISSRNENEADLLIFDSLKINPTQTGGLQLFRLAESPSKIIISGNIIEKILVVKSEEDWGISLEELA